MTARETNLVNAFETTLAAQLASGGTTMNLTDDPGVDAPVYLVIDPDNDSNREVILWSSGTNHAAATVTRDIDGKHGTDPTHAAGTQVRLAVVKQHIEEAHDAIQQGFVLEDGDGTEVTIAPAVSSGVYTQREVKFIDTGGLDINWTDTDAGTDGDPYDLTFTLDLNGLTEASVDVANDSIAIIDANDSNLTRKESLADVISSVQGLGLTASSGQLSVNTSQSIINLTGGYLNIFNDANNADVYLKMGTSATEALCVEVLNGTSNKTAEEIKISTKTASGTANHGKISIYIDDVEILDIDDGGIDLASGMTFAIDGADLPTTVHTAGNLIDFDGTDIDVDLSEAAEAAIADGDYILFLDGGATGTHAKEAIADVATLFAGTGLTASSSVISVDASQAITALTGGDLTIFDDANNADVSLKMGTSATEALAIEVLNGSSNKTAEEIRITTSTASGTANHGKISIYIDDTEILDIDDGGIDLASGKTVAIDGTDLPTVGGDSLNSVAAGAVNQAADSIVFIDADDSNATKKESIADFVDAIDGAGIDASSGTLVNAAIGKQSMWVPAAAMYPTASNGCAGITGVETTAGRPDMYVLDFDASSDENAQFSVAMPSYWNEGTVTFQVYWTTAATDTDGVAWALSGVACSDNDTIDVAFGTAVVVTDDALGAAEDLCVTAESGAVTLGGSPAAGDLAYFNIMRDVSDANDDMAEDARLIGVKLFYTVDDVHEA
tara:strand:+ start:3561 stop:5744 length:2184 start_codon:yes stop_codon:yes gene_type:complete